MKHRGGIAALALAFVLALSLGAAAGWLAAKPRFQSTISLRVTQEGDDTVFRGRVRSEDDRCERRRRVEVTAGNDGLGKPHPEGTARTDERGRYELRVPTEFNTIGNYRAKALRKSRRAFVCRAARSEIVNPSGGTRVSPAAGE